MGLFNRKKNTEDNDPLTKFASEMTKADQEGRIADKFAINEKFREYMQDDSYFYNRGSFLIEMEGTPEAKLEKFHEANEYFLKAVKVNPSYIKAWFRLANGYFVISQYEKSIDAFEKVIELESEKKKSDFIAVSEFSILITMLEILVGKYNGDITNWKNDPEYGSKIKEQIEKLREVFANVFDPSVFDTDDKIILGCRENTVLIQQKLLPDIPRFTIRYDPVND